jgi:hypothetical protein
VTRVVDQLVEDALRELADEHAQATLWNASGGPEVSSLAESKCRLWDDSGLSDAMERGVVYSKSIDTQLRQLRDVLRRIDESAPVDAILASPHLEAARALAKQVLESLRHYGYERAGP